MNARSALAPIAFFAFNRPTHATRTLAALAGNPEAAQSDLHIFVDAPRNDGDRPKVAEMVRVAGQTGGFATITVHAAAQNLGLYRSITTGVSELMSRHGRAIVVEDDVLVSGHFLAYMNEALDRYADDARVGCIHGYSPGSLALPEYFFLRGADCWGWASWADRWRQFRPDATGLLQELQHRGQVADFCASHGYRSLQLLCDRALERNQSWAILWHASMFLSGAHTLHPGRSFVANIGNDGSGVHADDTDAYDAMPRDDYAGLPAIEPIQDEGAARQMRRLLDGGQGPWPLRAARQLLCRARARESLRRVLRD